MRCSVLAFALLATLTAAAAQGASARPTLRLEAGPPALITGAHFTPRSVVRIFVSGPKASTFKVRATAHGTFRLAAPDVAGCSGFLVQAIGAHGERASVGIGMPNCAGNGVGDVSD